MKLAAVLILGSFFACVANSLSLGEAEANLNSQVRVASNDSCQVNVCFAIDSRNFRYSFDEIRSFVFNMTSALAPINNVKFAAVQYGDLIIQISNLTSNLDAFESAFLTTALERIGFSTASHGIMACTFELGAEVGKVSKIIVVSSGVITVESDAVRDASTFRKLLGEGASLSTVQVESTSVDTQKLRDIARAGGGQQYKPDEFLSLTCDILNLVRDQGCL